MSQTIIEAINNCASEFADEQIAKIMKSVDLSTMTEDEQRIFWFDAIRKLQSGADHPEYFGVLNNFWCDKIPVLHSCLEDIYKQLGSVIDAQAISKKTKGDYQKSAIDSLVEEIDKVVKQHCKTSDDVERKIDFMQKNFILYGVDALCLLGLYFSWHDGEHSESFGVNFHQRIDEAIRAINKVRTVLLGQ